jgi:hypothetical protein
MPTAGRGSASSRSSCSTGETALTWVVSITVGAPIAAFFTAIGAEAGKDAWRVIKTWARELTDLHPPHGYGDLQLEDPDGTRLDLRPPAMSDEQFAALLEIDWSRMRGGTLAWSFKQRRWIHNDEALAEIRRGLEDGTLFT